MEATYKCAPTQGKVKISPLRFVEVVVNGKAVRALKDSGEQIPLISQTLSQEIPTEIMGRIVIDGAVLSALVPRTNVGVQLAAEPGTINVSTAELPVVCGIIDLYDKEYDVILPVDVVSDLQQLPAVSVCVAECVNVDVVPSVPVVSMNEDTAAPLSDTDVINAEFVNHSSQSNESISEDANRLLHEQQQD